jgi:1,4-dihydroxy-2-naphthoate octaprenyltransferase
MGWLTPKQTARGATLCLVAALALGFYLSQYSESTSSRFDGIMLFITLSSVFNAVAYTGGPYPLGYIGLGNISIGYAGLGDLFVFLYFGLVATMTVPYLHLRRTTAATSFFQQPTSFSMKQLILHHPLMQISFLVALPVGFLATAIIVVNNLRDRKTDVIARKMTLAVRCGESFVRGEYTILVITSYLVLPCLIAWYSLSWTVVGLPLFSLPMALPQLKAVGYGGKDGRALNEHVGGTARIQLVFCLALALAIRNSS